VLSLAALRQETRTILPKAPGSMTSLWAIEFDLNVQHDFLLSKAKKEGPTLTLALNAFNVLNHENDTTFVGTITSPFFGRAVSAQPPRRMQLNLQFKF
jgi:outer membrane receptor protein involved in Fe transport